MSSVRYQTDGPVAIVTLDRYQVRNLGLEVIRSGETRAGAQRFAGGAGRHGSFD